MVAKVRHSLSLRVHQSIEDLEDNHVILGCKTENAILYNATCNINKTCLSAVKNVLLKISVAQVFMFFNVYIKCWLCQDL